MPRCSPPHAGISPAVSGADPLSRPAGSDRISMTHPGSRSAASPMPPADPVPRSECKYEGLCPAGPLSAIGSRDTIGLLGIILAARMTSAARWRKPGIRRATSRPATRISNRLGDTEGTYVSCEVVVPSITGAPPGRAAEPGVVPSRPLTTMSGSMNARRQAGMLVIYFPLYMTNISSGTAHERNADRHRR
jgi:hypothetical protein